MAVYYLDSSALVKRYAQEIGTTWIREITAPAAGHDIYLARITGPEIIAALFGKVRTREIIQADAIRAATHFRADFQMQYQIVELTVGVADQAMTLLISPSLVSMLISTGRRGVAGHLIKLILDDTAVESVAIRVIRGSIMQRPVCSA